MKEPKLGCIEEVDLYRTFWKNLPFAKLPINMPKRMSPTFYSALSQTNPELAIMLYTKEIELIDPGNFAAWHNRGLHKVLMGRDLGDKSMLLQGISDIRKSIKLAQQRGKKYPVAKETLRGALFLLNVSKGE